MKITDGWDIRSRSVCDMEKYAKYIDARVKSKSVLPDVHACNQRWIFKNI